MVRSTARDALLDAALALFRRNGYAATSVEDLCAAAGVTKGAFFHHFPNKEAVALAAAGRWTEVTGEVFAAADYRKRSDPLDRLLGYLDLRMEMADGALSDISCLAGTLVQETYGSHPAITAACGESIEAHAAGLEADIAAVMARRPPSGNWTAKDLALHTQAVLQGAFVIAKAEGSSRVAVESIAHLKRYFELLFLPPVAARAARPAPPADRPADPPGGS